MMDAAATTAYAGIGSRKTPLGQRELVQSIARQLGRSGYLLRSGGADGADTWFDEGARDVDGRRSVYLPWRGFNDVDDEDAVVFDRLPAARQAMEIAASFYQSPYGGTWGDLKQSVRKLMARNVMQVLGDDCASPSKFVICWAEGTEFDGRGRILNVAGGTGQAVRVAHGHRVPVFNLALPEHARRLERFCQAV